MRRNAATLRIMSFAGRKRADDTSPSPLEATVPADCAGLRVDRVVAQLFPSYSRSRLQHWIESGRVTVDGAATEVRRKVWGGEQVQLVPEPDPAASAFAPEDIPLQVVHEDDALLVVDKPAGLVVHPGSGNWAGTLLNALLAHAPAVTNLPRAGIVHRLDKDTSGLLVVAKTLEAQTDLVRQLQARTVSRRYLAAVSGSVVSAGRVDAPVGRHPVHRTRMAVTAHGKPAVTHYVPLRRGQRWTQIECRLETGRTHQIRVHMAHVGFPLLGDPVYGPPRLPPALAAAMAGFPRQALHAWRLALRHPVSGEEMAWESPVPADLAALLRRLPVDGGSDGA
ncbi:MAG: 23S rRNA pseudouridine(1911/1915/1917) synthase RluD [Burkholderiales bacterium]|nr:23S rRNA pseudouridine(1911/1915/1917) synthase RluD [Burkholderiales bacterium]